MRFKLIKYLLRKRIKLLVVACNTATVAGIDYFRSQFPKLPIVGVVPVVKTAAEVSKLHRFAILSTTFTAGSAYQKALIDKFAKDMKVYNLGTDELVPLIEAGNIESTKTNEALQKLLPDSLISQIDVLALGCTHFPLIRAEIQKIVGKKIRILDSGGAVCRQVARVLAHNGIENSPRNKPLETGRRLTHYFPNCCKNPRKFRKLKYEEVCWQKGSHTWRIRGRTGRGQIFFPRGCRDHCV